MFIASSVLWVSILIAVTLTVIGIACTIAELRGTLQVRQAVHHLGACLKYELVEFPMIEPGETGMIPAPVVRYRVMKTVDQYICPVCRCPAVCSSDYQSLKAGQHAPRLYTYRCLSGHMYLLRWSYNHWGSYERKDTKAYVAVQKKTASLL